MILLDTNVLSELMKSVPEPMVMQWINALPSSKCYICSVTQAEIELGIVLLPAGIRKKNLEAAARLMFNEVPGRCHPFDSAAAVRSARIVSGCTRSGRPISVEDAMIAAVALTNKMTLATRNIRDFECIDELNVINPWIQSPGI